MHFWKFIFFAALAGGLAFAGAFNQTLHLHWFATGTVLIYALLLASHIRKTKDTHGQHPESVYIVGYIATIGGFAGLAVFLGKNSEQIMDFKTVLPMILSRGGTAVISTLVGLAMMNMLKMLADEHSSPKNEQDEFIQQFSKNFADEFTKSLGSAENTAAFSENLAQMSGQMASTVAAMNQLHNTAQEVEHVMQVAGERMPQLVEGLSRFDELSNKILPAWEKLTQQAEDAGRLNAALAQSASSMEQVHQASAASAQAITSFAQSLPVLQHQFTGMLEQIRLRLDNLNRFGDELIRFLDYAKTASPILTTLGDGFGNLVQIKENLQLVSENLRRTNEQLITFNKGTVEITQTSSDFGRNIGTVGAQVANTVTELTRLTDPLRRIGEMAQMAASASEWFDLHSENLHSFKDNLTGLVATAEALKGAVKQTEEAVNGSVRTLRELQTLMPRLAMASARIDQMDPL